MAELPVVSKNTNELKTRLGCNKQVQMAKQPPREELAGLRQRARPPEVHPGKRTAHQASVVS